MCGEWRREPFAFVLTTGDNFSDPDGVATRDTFWRPERCLRALGARWRAVWGITYITTSGGGDTLYPCVRPAEGLRSCHLAHHFLAVRVSARVVDVRAVTPRGVTLDRVRIAVPPRS